MLIILPFILYYDADYKARVIYKDLLDNLDNLDYLNENNIEVESNTYSYSIKINDTSSLDVKLEYNDNSFTILKWQEIVNNNGDYDYQGFVH